MRFMKFIAKGILTVLFALTLAVGSEAAAEAAPVLNGAWAVGEDTEMVYNFCEDGTFTQWRIYYWGKCQPPDICREKIGCGNYTTGADAVSATLDLHYLQEDSCVALGRFSWDAGELCLNIGVCGEVRPELPCYYRMRPSDWVDCTCQGEGEVAEGEGEPGNDTPGCCTGDAKGAALGEKIGRIVSDWLVGGVSLIESGAMNLNRKP